MTKIQRITIIASAVLGICIMAGAAAFAMHHKSASYQHLTLRPVSKAELARSDGKNGHPCLVAVDGMVYRIEDNPEWQNGKHIPSNGLAYCGADMSKVIDQSPHGRKVLDILPKVGPLQS